MIKTLFITLSLFLMLDGVGLGQNRSGSPANKQEGKAHVTGAIGDLLLGVENEDQADFNTTDKGHTPIAVTKEGNVLIECITGCGSGTEFAEDTAHSTGALGTLILGVENEDQAALTAGDKDYTPVAVTPEGNTLVEIIGGTTVVTATDLDVQSGGADLATEATLGTIDIDTGNIDASLNVIDAGFAAEDAALGSGVLLQGDDGTNRKNIAVDATTGDMQVDVTNTVPVTATNLDVQIGGSDVVTVDLAGNNDVIATAGLLHGNSPTTEVAVLLLIDGSADTDVLTTNLSKSSAITVTGSGRITKVCLVVEGTAPFSEDGTIYFFDADPAINSNTADMTVAEAITVVAIVSLKGTDYNDNFATIKINCQAADESFHAITHVVYEQEGGTTITNQDFRLHILYERRS